MGREIGDLQNALEQKDELNRRLEGKRPAVFLDYDGVLTPIVDRPEDAVIPEGMQRVVRDLAERCVVCVVSGRDRKVVQDLMGLDNLIVAGSHGFDIWSPDEGRTQHEVGSEFAADLQEAKRRVHEEVESIEGSLI